MHFPRGARSNTLNTVQWHLNGQQQQRQTINLLMIPVVQKASKTERYQREFQFP